MLYRSNSSSQRGLAKTLDWKLIFCYLLLVLIGWINIYASIHSSNPSSIFDTSFRCGKQAIWIATAFTIALLILFVFKARLWEVISLPAYLAVAGLLVAVLFLGVDVNGSRSWFELGPVRFQPAELSKISTSLLLASFMSQYNFKLTRPKDFILACAILGIPMLIILCENETGSALVYVGFIFVLYREGLSGWFIFVIGMVILLFILTLTTSIFVSAIILLAVISFYCCAVEGRVKWWFYIGIPLIILAAFIPKLLALGAEDSFIATLKPEYALLGIALIAIPILCIIAYRRRLSSLWLGILSFFVGVVLIFSVQFIFDNVLKDHQRGRIEVLLGMKEDPTNLGYNVNQSMIAIGSGGMFGKGYLQGTQTTYGFVPEQSTDFIFCTVGEEWGFFGCLIVIILYVFMIYRIITDAEESREPFTRIYGYSVASLIFMHLFINIGMTIGLMPVIGIPLPFLSYGGSSLWAFTALLFIFIALSRDEKKYF